MIEEGVITHVDGCVLWPRVVKMTSFPQRLIGLLCYRGITSEQAFWFPHCRSVHTYGMKFPLDILVLNKQLIIIAVYRNVHPGEEVYERSAGSILEVAAGCGYPLEAWQGSQLIFLSKEAYHAISDTERESINVAERLC